MTKYVLLAILLLISGISFAAAPVLSFRTWKQTRMAEARSVLQSVRVEIKKTTKLEATLKPEKQRDLKRRLDQAQLNVEIATELTPNDYFVLYLSENYRGNGKAFQKAAEQMSNDEVSEIFMNYQKHLSRETDPRGPAESAFLVYKESTTASRPGRPERLKN